MKKKLEEYFEATKVAEYEDEKVQSSVLNIALSTSYRKLDSLKATEDYERYEQENRWLSGLSEKVARIPVISFDALKMQVNPELKSCDGFFYNADKDVNKYSLLVEFKNVNRSKILEYISSEEDDSIFSKVKDSISMIKNNIEFGDGYTGDELINRIHFIIVYGDRNDTVSTVSLGFKKVQPASKDHRGRQNRAVYVERKVETSTKKEDDLLSDFGNRLQELKLASCEKGHFGVPIKDPAVVKLKGIGKLYYFTMFSKHDFVKLVDEVGYFEKWNWGKYERFFSCMTT